MGGQVRYLQPVSLVKFRLGELKVNYPEDLYRLYLGLYAPKYVRQIVGKWEKGRELTDRDYFLLIKKAYANPYKHRVLPEDADMGVICGLELGTDGRLAVREDAKQEAETRTVRFCIEQILAPYTDPILEKHFPGEKINLGYWQEQISSEKLELGQTVQIAYIFTLYNFLWAAEAREQYGYFLNYYQTELTKRVSFVRQIWENRKPGEGLEYIPIFEDFRNLNPEKGAFMAQTISRILKSQDVQLGEKKIIEEALIRQAQMVLDSRDEEADRIKNSLITPVVSELVSLKKSREFLRAAEVCLENHLFNSVINRCYYAMLRAVRAALVSFGYGKPWHGANLRPLESHEELMLSFQKVLVEEKGLITREQYGFLRRVLQRRLIADYSDLEIKDNEAERVLVQARQFVARIEKIIGNN